MTSISSLTSQTNTAGTNNSQQSLDNQIQALEARIKDAAQAGIIGQDQADALRKQLDDIQKSFDSAATNGTLSAYDYRQIQRQLHQIGRTLLQASQASSQDGLAQATMQGLTDPTTPVPGTGDPLLDQGNTSTDTNWWGGVNITV